MDIKGIRERINLFIYNSKISNLKRFKVVSILVSLVSIGCLLTLHGFNFDAATNRMLQAVVEFSFGFYVLHYFVKIFYDFSPVQYVKTNWFEGSMVLLLLVEGLSVNFFDTLLLQTLFENLGMASAGALSVVFLQFYLFIVVFFELSDNTNLISNIKLHPSTIFISSFLVIIGLGTALLMMPAMTTMEGSMHFIDALFTSVSATCVTGLAVVDTAADFTYKGQFVIMLLMKLGGLNIVSFAYLAAFLNRVGFGVKQDEIIEDFITKDAFYNAKGMLLKVFSISLLIELIGGLLIYALITPDMPFETEGDKIFFGIFHSISAFNNGGFSTASAGLFTDYLQNSYLMHIVIGLLIFLGAFGFTIMFDLFTPRLMRERLRNPWKRPSVATRLGIRTHLALTAIGLLLFLVLEWNNTLADQNIVESTITSFFQSVTTRTAGLNTVDFAALSLPTILIIMILMFIGGNTYSTAGGIKTSTFIVVILNMIAVATGNKRTEVLGRSIPNDAIHKSYMIFLTFLFGMALSLFLLSISERSLLESHQITFIDLMFEEISAFSTVGLSLGITSSLSDSGKTILIFSMFIGRLGTLSIIFAFAKKILTTNYTYPTEHIMVG